MENGVTRRSIGNRVAPWRFILFTMLFVAGTPIAFRFTGDWLFAIMIAFILAAATFLISCVNLLTVRDSRTMRAHARANDANRAMLLAITGVVILVIMATVADEIVGSSPTRTSTRLMVIATLLLAWLFSNSIYALHYAHLAYRRATAEGCQGIEFPGTREPVYADFVYFAFTLGMTFQTSDVAINDGGIRREVTFHCLAAFVFNIGVLAFTINVIGN